MPLSLPSWEDHLAPLRRGLFLLRQARVRDGPKLSGGGAEECPLPRRRTGAARAGVAARREGPGKHSGGVVRPAGRGVATCGSSRARRCSQWIAPVAHVAGREPDTRRAGHGAETGGLPAATCAETLIDISRDRLGAKPECSGLQGLRHRAHGDDRCRSQASKFPGERRDGVLFLRSGDMRCRGADLV